MPRKSYFLLGLFILACLVLGVSKDQQTVTAQQRATAALEPYMIKDINPLGDSSPWQFVEMGGKIYFTATTEENGAELWVTDGTEAGTYLVKDINPHGPNGSEFDSDPSYLTVYNNELYFRATNLITGTELWKSDGTEAGTVLVKNINPEDSNPPADSSEPYGFVEFNGELFFVAEDGSWPPGLWKTDGTETGTVRVGSVFVYNSGSSLVALDDGIYFNGSLNILAMNEDQELWKSDGTDVGTVLVKDIRPEYYFSTPMSSSPKNLVNVEGTLFFTASTGSDPAIDPDNELWKSDGTEAGTVRVKDINPGDDSSNPDTLRNINGILYFRAKSGDSSYELWRSDGSEVGTYMVKDINPEPNYAGYPNLFRLGAYSVPALNNEIYLYGADLTNGFELWKSDGTDLGTVLIKDIYPGTESSFPLWMVSGGSFVYFTADNGASGVEMWQSDGTGTGTTMVKDIASGSGSSNPQWLSVVGNWLFFSADNGVHGRELWTMLLSELNESLYLPAVLR